MTPFGFDLLVLAVAVAGAAIAGIYLLMLAVPQNDDEHGPGVHERGRAGVADLIRSGGRSFSRGSMRTATAN